MEYRHGKERGMVMRFAARSIRAILARAMGDHRVSMARKVSSGILLLLMLAFALPAAGLAQTETVLWIEDFESDEPVRVLVVTKKVKKQIAPDVTAQIFWLKNRRPDKWRDRKDFEVSGSEEGLPVRIIHELNPPNGQPNDFNGERQIDTSGKLLKDGK